MVSSAPFSTVHVLDSLLIHGHLMTILIIVIHLGVVGHLDEGIGVRGQVCDMTIMTSIMIAPLLLNHLSKSVKP